jgi:hypothetical protein
VKLKQSEIKNLIKQAMDKQTDIYEAIKDSPNSQVILMAQYTKGVKETLSDVMAALNGNPVYLRLLAGK